MCLLLTVGQRYAPPENVPQAKLRFAISKIKQVISCLQEWMERNISSEFLLRFFNTHTISRKLTFQGLFCKAAYWCQGQMRPLDPIPLAFPRPPRFQLPRHRPPHRIMPWAKSASCCPKWKGKNTKLNEITSPSFH